MDTLEKAQRDMASDVYQSAALAPLGMGKGTAIGKAYDVGGGYYNNPFPGVDPVMLAEAVEGGAALPLLVKAVPLAVKAAGQTSIGRFLRQLASDETSGAAFRNMNDAQIDNLAGQIADQHADVSRQARNTSTARGAADIARGRMAARAGQELPPGPSGRGFSDLALTDLQGFDSAFRADPRGAMEDLANQILERFRVSGDKVQLDEDLSFLLTDMYDPQYVAGHGMIEQLAQQVKVRAQRIDPSVRYPVRVGEVDIDELASLPRDPSHLSRQTQPEWNFSPELERAIQNSPMGPNPRMPDYIDIRYTLDEAQADLALVDAHLARIDAGEFGDNIDPGVYEVLMSTKTNLEEQIMDINRLGPLRRDQLDVDPPREVAPTREAPYDYYGHHTDNFPDADEFNAMLAEEAKATRQREGMSGEAARQAEYEGYDGAYGPDPDVALVPPTTPAKARLLADLEHALTKQDSYFMDEYAEIFSDMGFIPPADKTKLIDNDAFNGLAEDAAKAINKAIDAGMIDDPSLLPRGIDRVNLEMEKMGYDMSEMKPVDGRRPTGKIDSTPPRDAVYNPWEDPNVFPSGYTDSSDLAKEMNRKNPERALARRRELHKTRADLTSQSPQQYDTTTAREYMEGRGVDADGLPGLPDIDLARQRHPLRDDEEAMRMLNKIAQLEATGDYAEAGRVSREIDNMARLRGVTLPDRDPGIHFPGTRDMPVRQRPKGEPEGMSGKDLERQQAEGYTPVDDELEETLQMGLPLRERTESVASKVLSEARVKALREDLMLARARNDLDSVADILRQLDAHEKLK